MENNYTKPNEPNYKDKPEDWLSISLIFSKTIGKLLNENQGVVIKLENDMNSSKDLKNVDKVIVYNESNQIKIIECEYDNLEDGEIIEFE